MSTFLKTVLSLLVIVAVIFGLKYMGQNKKPAPVPIAQENTPLPPPKPASTIGEDISSIDAQINIVDANSAAADQSLNDKPVPQTE